MESGNVGPLSQLRFRDLSGEANSALEDAMQESIRINPDPHLGFFNRANNISLKVHAFQLLPGVGSSTAQSWVKIRGQNGWVDLAEVSEKLGVEVVDLLAERYVGELAEPAEVPSLLDLLVRVSA
jgi:putative nucleotide binding protein